MKLSLIVFAFFAYSGIAAAQTKWEYQMVDYETKEKFEPVLKTMGEQGWEFAGCPVTGSSHYTAIISGGNGSFTGYIGRSVYCIFKRALN